MECVFGECTVVEMKIEVDSFVIGALVAICDLLCEEGPQLWIILRLLFVVCFWYDHAYNSFAIMLF